MGRSHPDCWTGTEYRHTDCHRPSGRICIECRAAEAGTGWGPYFCADCDVIRLDQITRSLESIAEDGASDE